MSRYLIRYQDDIDSVLVGIGDIEVVVFVSMEFAREKVWWEFVVGVCSRNLYLERGFFGLIFFFGVLKKLCGSGKGESWRGAGGLDNNIGVEITGGDSKDFAFSRRCGFWVQLAQGRDEGVEIEVNNTVTKHGTDSRIMNT